MDAELAMIMANMACLGPGSTMLDPYCGTGGLLVAASDVGAAVWGCELDGRILKGECGIRIGKDIMDNYRQYELPPPQDLIRNDSYQFMWRSDEFFDAILTDPPYGVCVCMFVLMNGYPCVYSCVTMHTFVRV